MKTFFLSLFFSLLFTAGLIFLGRDFIAKAVCESKVSRLTGLKTVVEKVEFDLGKGALRLRDLLFLNPPGFEKRVFGDAVEIYLEMDLPALLKGEKVHLKKLRLDLRELNVEKNPQGISNLSLLSKLWKRPSPKPSPGPKKKRPFRLDRLELRLREVTYHDRTGLLPKKVSVTLPPEETVHENITEGKAIVQIIMMRVISETPYGNLGINPIEINRQLKRSVGTFGQIGKKVFFQPGAQFAEKAGEVGKTMAEQGKQTFGHVVETVRSTLKPSDAKAK